MVSEGGGEGRKIGKIGPEDPVLSPQLRDTHRKRVPIRLSFVPHDSLEANGKSALNCK